MTPRLYIIHKIESHFPGGLVLGNLADGFHLHGIGPKPVSFALDPEIDNDPSVDVEHLAKTFIDSIEQTLKEVHLAAL